MYLDADTRCLGCKPRAPRLDAGLAVTPFVNRSVAEHLEFCGQWRAPAFAEIARELTGGMDILERARWCHEACIAVTKDGREGVFFETWGRLAGMLQDRRVFSGEGGVIGMAAAMAGWSVDYQRIKPLAAAFSHEGGGPKGG